MTTKKQTKEVNLKPAINELHKVYARANTVLFNNELPSDIVINIQSRGKRKAYGWMYTQPIWETGEESNELFEIGIASETLKRDYFETITTLIHEMVHVWNVLKDIQDTSRGNTYHNKKFLASCEAHGLEYIHEQPDSRIGYSAVTLKPETVNKIKFWGINKDAFSVSRKDMNGTGKAKKKSNIIKWECGCGDIVRTSKDGLNAICGKCGTRFEQAD